MIDIGLNKKNDKEKYDKFYINDFVNDFEEQVKDKIFATDEEAEENYIKKYGIEKNKSSIDGFKFSNTVRKMEPIKLTKNQKTKLLLLLKESNCEADIYMSYDDILRLKRDTNE